MDTRFRSSNSAGAELPWQSIESLLDALEDGRLEADDYVFDAVRQAWQPARKHSEIVAGWHQRMSYRPLELRRPLGVVCRPAEGFPALSAEGMTPVSTPALSRIEAAHRARLLQPEEMPSVRRAIAAGEVALVALLVGGIGFSLVWAGQTGFGLVARIFSVP